MLKELLSRNTSSVTRLGAVPDLDDEFMDKTELFRSIAKTKGAVKQVVRKTSRRV
jgi:hypothetical protein